MFAHTNSRTLTLPFFIAQKKIDEFPSNIIFIITSIFQFVIYNWHDTKRNFKIINNNKCLISPTVKIQSEFQ